jgi:hypothetical protein
MKTTWMKAALMMAIVASTGAITLAAGNKKDDDMARLPDKGFEFVADQEHEQSAFYQWVKKQLKIPDFIENGHEDNRVEIHLEIAKDGKPVIHHIRSNNDHLKQYVIRKFQSLIYPDEFSDQSYQFTIRFHIMPSFSKTI